jgi:hypothetical protein
MEGISVSKAVFEFTQDGNTLGTTEEVESLRVSLEYQLPEPGKAGECFIVLETKGWSIDSPESLANLLENCRKAVMLVDTEVEHASAEKDVH